MNIERKIVLGRDKVSMMDPPNEGTVIEGVAVWHIGRNSSGMIVLQKPGHLWICHADFREGMDMHQFCRWINEYYVPPTEEQLEQWASAAELRANTQ